MNLFTQKNLHLGFIDLTDFSLICLYVYQDYNKSGLVSSWCIVVRNISLKMHVQCTDSIKRL